MILRAILRKFTSQQFKKDFSKRRYSLNNYNPKNKRLNHLNKLKM